MNDYLSLLPSTLQWVSAQLGSVSSIPWPLWIGGLFPVYLAVVSGVLWLLRGRFWLLSCAYPRTSKGRPCRIVVAGEWARCRHHNRPRRYAYGHQVQKLYRWQTFARGGEIVDSPDRGVGMFRLRPGGSTLLYVRGYARPPMAVLRLLPDKVKDGIGRLRKARLTAPAAPEYSGTGRAADLADGLGGVVAATRFATAAFCVAIVLTVVAIPLSGLAQTILQYLATLGFVLAWAATYSGLYTRSATWLRGACVKAAKWWALTFVPVGLANLGFTVLNTSPS
ncbi:hypothetical protein [Amycolatopsis jiangsuensis]|uniref:Uncharacterized protein n=1 Tax=Amycolatopsis jiangsuensis TaxID=1181879 RepID=A0A840J798_9PSEU|nr:hypothetical protein [Amycolatopsis jiangsuensis]MBB4689304.1 hypothetical protein [Amycolatopsis jiangsuensis]